MPRASGAVEAVQGEGHASSPFVPSEHGWQPVQLAELASHGFPFSPAFLQPRPPSEPGQSVAAEKAARPLGEYDPHTQTCTTALCAGGDTGGGTIDTGHYTAICGGDGVGSAKEWDTSPDRVTD